MKRWRAYVMGFIPPGEQFDEALTKERIESCDFCTQAPDNSTIPIGAAWRVDRVIFDGDSNGPPIGTWVRCVSHEHSGKIVVIEEIARPS